MPVIGTIISKKKAASLLGYPESLLSAWERNGVVLYRRHNNKRMYYLEDILNFLISRGLPTRSMICNMSVSGTSPRRRKGGGAGK